MDRCRAFENIYASGPDRKVDKSPILSSGEGGSVTLPALPRGTAEVLAGADGRVTFESIMAFMRRGPR